MFTHQPRLSVHLSLRSGEVLFVRFSSTNKEKHVAPCFSSLSFSFCIFCLLAPQTPPGSAALVSCWTFFCSQRKLSSRVINHNFSTNEPSAELFLLGSETVPGERSQQSSVIRRPSRCWMRDDVWEQQGGFVMDQLQQQR